jgi:anti-sigma B factor antagonist
VRERLRPSSLAPHVTISRTSRSHSYCQLFFTRFSLDNIPTREQILPQKAPGSGISSIARIPLPSRAQHPRLGSALITKSNACLEEAPLETAIGVFGSRERAEEAVKELLDKHVPKDSIVFLTRSENEAAALATELGTYAGGFIGGAAGLSAGVAAATLFLIPGIGQVFALGVGATALLGFLGSQTGAAVGKAISDDPETPQPTATESCSEDAALFLEPLKQGRSLVVVRTDSPQAAATACATLDRLGMSMQARAAAKMQAATRQIGEIAIVDISGRITLGEGNVMLREIMVDLLEKGNKHILLNMTQVIHVDSAGIGELVRSHTSARKKGGHLKLVNPHQKVRDLLQMTMLSAVFDIQEDEHSAIRSFGLSSKAAG